MRYTQTPRWLLEPRQSAISRAARREGLPNLDQDDIDFVHDLLSKEVGEQVAPFDSNAWREWANSKATQTLKDRNCRPGSYYYDEDQKALSDSYLHLKQSEHQVIGQSRLTDIPGKNALQKAVRILKLVKLMKQAQSMPYINMPGMILTASTTIAENSEMLLQLLTLLTAGDEASDETAQLGMEIAVQKIDMAEMLRIARQLDEISDLAAPKAKPTSDPNGEDVQLRDILEIGELPRTGHQALALPHRLRTYRAVAGGLAVREPITRKDKKQLLYILLDSSGSMNDESGKRIGRAVGVVLNRLQAVAKGEAELYLRFFDTELGAKEYHANSAESARKLMRIITNSSAYSGGGTNFVGPLTTAYRRINQLVASGTLRDPEVMMITDGEAYSPTKEQLAGLKLHVVQVGDEVVHKLAKLARATGGVNIDATSGNAVVR